MTETATVRVDLEPRPYDIHVGAGLLARTADLVAPLHPSRVLVLTHPAIARLHGPALLAPFGANSPEVIEIPSGERRKSLRWAARLYDELLARRADRASVLLTFGGGVVGDLGGFVAATYMRGLRFVQVPTTLLAQVDASVGGKVAVDHPHAKNLIGAFYQPSLVVADTSTLHTLPAREYRCGLAEVVKHGVIADAVFFAWLEDSTPAVAARDPDALLHLVRRNCEIKAAVVAADEREAGLRAILNFGHTAGHALETLTGYRALRHGEAVAMGMVAAARLSETLGLCPPEVGNRIARLLTAFRLPTTLPALDTDELIATMRSDKKAVAGTIRFVLPRDIGTVEIVDQVPEAALREALQRNRSAAEKQSRSLDPNP